MVREQRAHGRQIRRWMEQHIRGERAETLPLEFLLDRISRRTADRFLRYDHHAPFAIPVLVAAPVDAVFSVSELSVTSLGKLVIALATG